MMFLSGKPESENGNKRLIETFSILRRDIAAGALASLVNLPICLAAGVLAFAPLGPSHAAIGAAAGLCGAIVAGGVSAITATSSCITTVPRVSTSLVLGSLVALLSKQGTFAHEKDLLVASLFICVAMGGLWQIAFALAGVAKVIKFTPHPVLVGFMNGVAVLIATSQLKPYFLVDPLTSTYFIADHLTMFCLMLTVAALLLYWPTISRALPNVRFLIRTPSIPIAFFSGTAAFYIIKQFYSAVDLGATVGRLTIQSPIPGLANLDLPKHLASFGPEILSISFVLAIVATIDTLFVFRATQNIADIRIAPVRDLFAQGLGNFTAALAGGVTGSASPTGTIAAYRVGAKTVVAPVSSALILFVSIAFFPRLLESIPAIVLSGILLGISIQMFDRWTFQAIAEARNATTALDRRHYVYDLAVVLIVMSLTVFYSVVAGVIAGCMLAGIIFVINMSRPVVTRVSMGSTLQSKRLRSARDAAILTQTGSERVVLQLEGVLFFGNADDLSVKTKTLFQHSRMVTLDMRGVTDLDVSGANILAGLIAKSREIQKDLLFSGVPSALAAKIMRLVLKGGGTNDLIKQDLDSALEWMEEKSLLLHSNDRAQADVLSLSEIDFLAGIQGPELDRLARVLKHREFLSGEKICQEGDDGDRMWLLAKGSVSVRLNASDGHKGVRIASLARGTTIGEMSLIDSAKRSASIVADEPVVCYEFALSDFNQILSESPDIGSKLLSNLARELSRRLRRTSDDLRNRN